MSKKEKLRTLYHNSFNPTYALMSAGFNGTVAGIANANQGDYQTLRASLTAAGVAFLMTGVTSRIVQHFSPIEDKIKSYLGGSLVPAAITFGAHSIGHTLNQTQSYWIPVLSAAGLSLTTSYATNFITRNFGWFRPKNYPTIETEKVKTIEEKI